MIIHLYRQLFLFLWNYLGFFGAIVGISTVVSMICLPLYAIIGKMVAKENELQGELYPLIDELKRKYADDSASYQAALERLYKRYQYNPFLAIRKVLPLFVALPFLFLTYYMLEGAEQLNGVSFLCFKDVGKADGLLWGINLLPFVMTGINLLTAFATPGLTKKDRSQAVFIALFFLVFLYTANAALMIYWCMNQFFNMLRSLYADRWAGAKLLVGRLLSLIHTCAPGSVLRWMSSLSLTIWAQISLFLVIVACYFCIIARLMWNMNGGFNLWIMYKGMILVLTVTSLFSVPLFRLQHKVIRLVAYASTFVCLSFTLGLTSVYLCSRTGFRLFLEYVNLFVVMAVLFGVWSAPFVIIAARRFRARFQDVASGVLTVWPLLGIPVVLAIHYSYSSDMFTLPLSSVFYLAAYMVLLPVVAYCVVVLLYGEWLSPDWIFKLVLGVFIAIYVIPMTIFGDGWFSYNHNLLVRLFVMALGGFACIRLRQRFPISIFLMFLVLSTIINVYSRHRTNGVGKELVNKNGRDLSYVLGDIPCVKSNSVYLCIYDSYGHQSILRGLNLSDEKIYDKLRNSGFRIYDAYSEGADTLASMSRVFTLNGVCGKTQRSTLAGDNAFSDFFKRNGYKTFYVLGGYEMPNREERMPGDYYYPGEAELVRPEQMLLPCVLRGALSQSPSIFNGYTHEDWIAAYRNVICNCDKSRSFVYAHNTYPNHAHWNPRYRKSDAEEQREYKKRLAVADKEIQETVEMLDGDRESIVVIASDHGGSLLIPDPPGNYDVRNLIDHHGILLAIRWPKDYRPCLRLDCLQNVMIEIVIYLTGNRGLSKLAVSGETLPLEWPISTPRGLINNGILHFGIYKGESLFEAAKKVFEEGD